ncbi:M20/M25/M40 family metallo-hydrolase [Rheinheimera texasensis]|uniref:M20/M25/M40 family metallo-hydrolase n=1 Tax=Rheinheimera texasensis TaxID=306205 RepID=UPI000A041CD3|nr:M20/M25/M40 family metallo-hydrolase [Rheinheimera texasensis]
MYKNHFQQIFFSLAVATFCASGHVQAQTNPASDPTQVSGAAFPADIQVLQAAQHSFTEYFQLLALPNDAVNAADIRSNADWLSAAFQRRGFQTQQLANQGKPLVFAHYHSAQKDAATLLLYLHFDGQPVMPKQWAQSSPWQAVVKKRDAGGQWQTVDAALLQQNPLDAELRVFARAAADDKGPIMMLLAAFDALKAAGQSPAFHVKVLLDSEEEKGSPTINAIAKTNAKLLHSDGLIILDGPQHPSNQPTLVFGNRGATSLTLTVYGPKTPLHSGHYGNYVPNPAQRLATLLASMKDDDGRVTVAGYYDTVKLSAAERLALSEVPDDDAALRQRTGIARPDAVGHSYQEALQYPSLNIRGMQAAAVGDKAANIIPHQAVAELDLRTTPEADSAYLTGLLERHIKAQGWYLSQGEPTADERAKYPKIASLTAGAGGDAARTPMDSKLGNWVYAVLQQDGRQVVRIRMMGGSLPTAQLVSALEIPFVILPLVNADNNQHSFDENLRIGHYVDGVQTLVRLLRTAY